MTITKLTDRLSVSPQIRPADLASLYAAGFRCVINNRPDDEEPGQPGSAAIATAAEKLGMDYHHIPVTPGAMTDADALAFGAAVAASQGPIFAFCRSGARSTKAWERSQQLAGTCG